MSKFTFTASIFVFLLLSGCTTTSNLSQLNDKAAKAYSVGDFETAFNLYNTFIKEEQSKNNEISGEIFGAAAKAALEINKFIDAETYFKQASYKGYADADLYASMINIYKRIDNLSKEISALEFFVEHFSSDKRFADMKIRLFEIYVQSENWDKAVAIWSSFNAEAQNEIHLMELYLIVQQNLKNNSLSNKLATSILKKDVTNKTALEWMANENFWKAENRYQAELEDYEKNKTNKQYNIMLKALDGVTADFKKSLKYYEMLYKLYPSKEYAKYMSNIYVRFQDKNKSEYYRKLSL